MKNILFIFLIAACSMSCKKFLEETSPSIVIPTQVGHYEEMLYGEGYPSYSSGGYSRAIELLTDDVEWGHLTTVPAILLPLKAYSTKGLYSMYLFDQDPEQTSINGSDDYWAVLYRAINVCNVAIDGLSKTTDDAQRKKQITGQAYACRAMHYLELMNMYGMPYVKSADSEWGVPIKTSSVAEDRLYMRNSVHEVYRLIKSDIDSAVQLLNPELPLKLFEMNWFAAATIATRVNLYMENYDEVIRLGESYLNRKSQLPPSSATLNDGHFMGYTASFSGVTQNPEVVFHYGISPAVANTVHQASTTADHFIVSMGLRNLFLKSLKSGEIDKRMSNPTGVTASWFFGVASTKYVPRKIHNFNIANRTLRTGEIMLNLAEAYAHKNNVPASLTLINTLRTSRIVNYAGFTANEFSQETLIQFIAEERRRELCFESHRLPDLKRYGMPTMEHKIQDFTGEYKVSITAGDFGYIFQIPLIERERNPEVKLIPRSARNVEPI